MQERIQVKLENYRFTGLDASQLGAVKSVADYYQIPLTPTKIYGLTGLAFLIVLDEHFVQPNAGPPEPELFRLVRNLGIHIEGIHEFAEGANISILQADAWEKAKVAIRSNKPVFAKNIAQENQTSVILAYDELGYYIDSWHTGYEKSQDMIRWDSLGLNLCPCIHCVNERKVNEPKEPASRLISLHWATPVAAIDEWVAIKDAFQYVIRLNEEGTYEDFGKRYFVGPRAYEEWIHAIECNSIFKYEFALIIEVLNEARSHAKLFLKEIQDKLDEKAKLLVEEAITVYSEIGSEANILKTKYPYEQPRELFKDAEREELVAKLRVMLILEKRALLLLKKLYRFLQ